MRRTQKKQIVDTIYEFSNFHENINDLFINGQKQTCLDILTSCQEGAIKIGNIIDASEGEGTESVHLLETYCELVFNLYDNISSNNLLADSVKKMTEGLDSQIEKAGKEIKESIKTHIEAVFMPYKASMWDSMETIYLAAKKDPLCDAYLLPIPYFDKNPDGTYKEAHYEADMFPKEYEIMPFTKYDLAQRKPDVIFIHNPYDEFNTVTTVHPSYYSHELKKFTDCLVYVPYFSSADGLMSSTRSSLSAYYFADYIIAQSEKQIECFDKAIPRDKIIALGSPKFDHVILECQKKQDVPRQWHEMMDGKKVFFYNTSIQGMLTDTKAFLNKMEYVFETFLKNKNVCLLWRPHPLLESSFESMRPEFKPYYDKLKQVYIDKKIGIYDDTSDIAKSLAISDVYIGDNGTSVSSLAGATGKPVFILDDSINHVLSNEDINNSMFESFYENTSDRWIIGEGNQLFFSVNNDHKYKYVCRFDEYSAQNYRKVYDLGDRLIICPLFSDHFIIIENGVVKQFIPIEHLPNDNMGFCESCKYGKYIFLIPLYYKSIVRLNVETEKIDYISGCNDIYISSQAGQCYFGGMCVFQNFILLGSPTDERILSIEMNTLKTQIIGVGERTDVNTTAIVADTDKTTLWFIPLKGITVRHWNPMTGKCKYYEKIDSSLKTENYSAERLLNSEVFSSGVSYEKKLLLATRFGKKFMQLDVKTGRGREWEPIFSIEKQGNNNCVLDTSYRLYQKKYGSCVGKCRCKDYGNNKEYDFDLKKNTAVEIKVQFDINELSKYSYGFCNLSDNERYCCKEDAINSLLDLINGTISGAKFDKTKEFKSYSEIAANMDGTCGEKIYDFVCDKVNSNIKKDDK